MRPRAAAVLALLLLLVTAFGEDEPGAPRSPRESARAADGLSAPPAADSRQNVLCGPRCLWLVARLYGVDADLAELAERARTEARDGTAVYDMVATLRGLGLGAALVRTTLPGLARGGRLYILVVRERSHYVLFEKIADGEVTVIDGTGRRRLSLEDFQAWWDGLAIAVSRKSADSRRVRRQPHLAILAGALGGAAAAAGAVFGRKIRRGA